LSRGNEQSHGYSPWCTWLHIKRAVPFLSFNIIPFILFFFSFQDNLRKVIRVTLMSLMFFSINVPHKNNTSNCDLWAYHSFILTICSNSYATYYLTSSKFYHYQKLSHQNLNLSLVIYDDYIILLPDQSKN